MKYIEIIINEQVDQPVRQRQYSVDEVKEIGDCAIIAMSLVTGLTWDAVFEQAKEHFHNGMNAGGIYRTMQALGWNIESYFKMPWITPLRVMDKQQKNGMTVQAGEKWLKENAPEARLLCYINVSGIPHTIAFVDGKFHNVQGAYRAKFRSVYICSHL